MLTITPAVNTAITKIVCPACGERAARIGLLPGSKVEGLTFKCRKCALLWEVKSK